MEPEDNYRKEAIRRLLAVESYMCPCEHILSAKASKLIYETIQTLRAEMGKPEDHGGYRYPNVWEY